MKDKPHDNQAQTWFPLLCHGPTLLTLTGLDWIALDFFFSFLSDLYFWAKTRRN